MVHFYGGGLLTALLFFPLSMYSQLSILNGLSQYLSCGGSQWGEIWLQNEGDSAITVLLERSMLIGNADELDLPSEVHLSSKEQLALPYRWNPRDSLARHAEIEVYALSPIPASNAGSWKVISEIHYLINLFSGCMDPNPINSLKIQRDTSMHFKYEGMHFWQAKAQAYSGLSQPIDQHWSLFFYPGREYHILPPNKCAYVLVEDTYGHVIGIPWNSNAP